MSADSASRPWRRFLRFSVRGLIVLVLVIGAGLGWLVHQAHIQRDAVAAIRKAGGTVWYDWDEDITGRPLRPGWLVRTFGVDYFRNVTAVDFYEAASTPSDATCTQIAILTRIKRLRVARSPIGDAGLAQLDLNQA